MGDLYICRHGETEWSLSGQHTGITDLPLTENGVRQAQELAEKIRGHHFAKVFTSPLMRAKHTCEICGFPHASIDEDLFEWRYGDYEGKKTSEIRDAVPGWNIFDNGAPNGETPQQISDRADRMIRKIRTIDGDVAIFSSGHFSRALAARWLGFPVTLGKHLILSTATLSILGYERENPAIKQWNAR